MVGVLVDVLAARAFARHRSGDRCSLARLVANTVVVAQGIDPLPSTLRRAFDLRAVALLRSAGGRWVWRTRREAGARPSEDANYRWSLPDRSVLGPRRERRHWS